MNGSYAQELPKVVLLPDTVSIKILDTLNLTFWKLRKITVISTGNAATKETNCSMILLAKMFLFQKETRNGWRKLKKGRRG